MWCCFSFSDISQSSKTYVFVVLSSMASTVLFFFLPWTFLYLCQNWFSSRDSFMNFMVFFWSFIFDSFIINCWYFILSAYNISRLAMLCLLLNLWLAFLSSFLDFLMSLRYQSCLSLFVVFVCPKKRVALFIMCVLVFLFDCLFLLLLSLFGILLGNLLGVVLEILSILSSLHFLFWT